MPSFPGGVLSIGLFVVLAIYASMKFSRLVKRTNPNISSFVEQGAIATDEKFNLRDIGIKFAFGVEGYLDK